jgi:DNA (cytosine-5)-methyltransferase 1
MSRFSVVEFCIGGGGQALGLEAAGFDCVGAVEIDGNCCTTLRMNRPHWDVRQDDMRVVDGHRWDGVDLFAAGVPCPPFSIAGKQLGVSDERDMFPDALRLISEMHPKAVLLENVPGFASAKFAGYRKRLFADLEKLGYETTWQVLQPTSVCHNFVLGSFLSPCPKGACLFLNGQNPTRIKLLLQKRSRI